MKRTLPGVALGVALLLLPASPTIGGEPLRSGLRIGQFAQPFQVRDCTGPAAGKTLCYYCRYGNRPVISVFTRQLNDDLGRLVGTLDEQVRKHRADRLAAFVVLLEDNPFEAERRLKAFARKHAIQHTPLTVYRDSKQLLADGYQIHPRASLTVMMWKAGQVRASHSFATTPGEAEPIAGIVASARALIQAAGRP